jgi:exopolyphosphatase/guanosine-5'-triphosphate,3'-diphosphate pyrophosphatase
LLVAEPHGQSFRVVDAFSRIVRLGEGLSQTGRLSNEAQERAISALKVCQSKLAYRRVKRFRLIATEACRRALNGGAFLHRVYKETGLKLEIVNRETEARLAVAGCASLVHPEAEGVVLFDIGGGSSEIVWLDLDPVAEEGLPQPGEKRNRQTRRAMRHLSERMRCWTSLQVGVVTLSEKHGGHVVTREHFEAMVAEVREMLHEFEEREALAHAIENKHIHMLGTSGTVTTLAGVHLGLVRYDRRQVDGTWLNADEVRSMINRVLEMDFEERIANPCIGQDRADLVLAGCAILEALHREWPCPRLRVADRGLREGILMEMMIDDGVWTPQQNKKRAGKNRRPRRRGGRGHRGHNTGQGSNHDGNQPSAPKEG